MPYSYLILVVSEEPLVVKDGNVVVLENPAGDEIYGPLLEVSRSDYGSLQDTLTEIVCRTVASAKNG